MIDINLKEGKNYFIRYFVYKFLGNKTGELRQLHGRLIEINLDKKELIFNTDEQFEQFIYIKARDILTIVEIKNKGARLIEILD